MVSPPRIGVLALQGDFLAHHKVLTSLGAEPIEVRDPGALDPLAGLIIPGGESTTLLRLLDSDPAWQPALEALHREGRPIFGTCAGLILLARGVSSPPQPSLGFLDVCVARNAYGRQVDSFEARGRWRDGGPLEMVFIRAPRITEVGPQVTVLAHLGGEPVLVRQTNILAASFHPELSAETSPVHAYFLGMVSGDGASRPGQRPAQPALRP